MEPWEFVISGTVTVTAATTGYVVGTLRPIIGRDYHMDRKWCEHLRKLYKDAINLIEEYDLSEDMGNFEEKRGQISILYNEIEDHINEYPNYRRKERNQAKKISQDLDEISKTWPEEGLELRSSRIKNPPTYIRKHISENNSELMTLEEFTGYKDRILNRIQKANKSLSYGKIHFIKSVIARDRTL